MKAFGNQYRTIWVKEQDTTTVQVINQQKLPHVFEIMDLKTLDDALRAIKDMYIRGAGLIGATAGFGMYLAALNAPDAGFDDSMEKAARLLVATRPTAKNLEWAVKRMISAMSEGKTYSEKRSLAFSTACAIADEDAEFGRRIGEHGVKLIEEISRKKKGNTVNILTHCNAGWLAFVDYGSATAPIYAAYEKGIDIHVWVDETRPRNQGASLTAWELGQHGVPHHLIVDNAGGHLMQHGMVDICIVGADRVTRTGDVANKIGTYLKALAAKDNGIPFYVALPSSTFDWDMRDGLASIPIEERDEHEVRSVQGLCRGAIEEVLICPQTTRAKNYGFDVTPARLICGLITERGICGADETSILALYPEHR